jgi:hypothetical protein
LPEEFHQSKSFKSVLNILKKDLGNASVLESGKIDGPLLLFGLIFREVSRAIETEPDAPGESPEYLAHSPFDIQDMLKIEEMIDNMVLPDD